MDDKRDIPFHEFRFPHKAAIPFGIIRIEALDPSTWSPMPVFVNRKSTHLTIGKVPT
jgi:hypothetical protein